MKFVKQLSITLLLLSSSNAILCKDNGIKLTSPILAAIDGVPNILDEHTIHKALYVRQEINKILLGILDKNNKRQPQYNFNGRLYTVKQLVKLEKEKGSSKALNDLFEKIRGDFIRITEPFVAESRHTKKQMMALITESCKKRNKPNSLLFHWGDDNEKENMIKNVTNFKIFDTFCTDLSDFLKDLVISCPKAFQKFKDWQAKQGKK